MKKPLHLFPTEPAVSTRGSILTQHTPYKHKHTINQRHLQKILGGFRNFHIHYEDQLETVGFQFHTTTKDPHWTEGVAYDA